jgi:branched-chain amino acid transport system substrate-binding protein
MKKRSHVIASQQRRQVIKGSVAAFGLASIGLPAISLAQNKPIKIGMPTILSGRVAMLGEASRNAAIMAADTFNAAGGLNGRPIELVIRDSKGRPDEAARIARELVNSDGCEMILDAEASSGAFAVHEVARDLGVLVMHTCSETSALSADPKMRIPNAFRAARQGIHDAIVGGDYSGRVAKERGLKRWMSISPDYSYGLDTTAEFFEYLKYFNKDVEVVNSVWPKLFQADYSEPITRLLQGKPQAIYSCLWGGDLTSFIDQASIYGLMNDRQFFGVNMADYAVLTAIKSVPPNVHSGNRYLKSIPKTQQNAQWCDAYLAKFKTMPLNWSWENAVGMEFLIQAIKKTNGTDTKKMSAALEGMTVNSPFGTNGTITMRASDHTIIDYAIAWGTLQPKEPYMPNPYMGNWKTILELEAQWMKNKGYVS